MMSKILKLFKGKTATTNVYQRAEPRRVLHGHSLDSIDFKSIYPWACEEVDSSKVTIGEIIIMWWCDKYHTKPERTVPLYFTDNYVKSFENSKESLILRGWLNSNGSLTEKGSELLIKHFVYVELHRNNWVSEADSRYNRNAYISDIKEHNDYLRFIGLYEIAGMNQRNLTNDTRQLELRRIFGAAEQLSKEGRLAESNEILIALKNSDFQQQIRVYNRLCINYRKQKNYSSEIETIDEFLNIHQPKYGGDMHKAELLGRRKKAEELRKH